MKMNDNVVYANRNFLPFFKNSMPTGGGNNLSNYGAWNQDYIKDGSGVYLTRNQDYTGKMSITNNIAYDNGINGLVVHKTTNDDVTVYVSGNRVFENGKTDKEIEGRQSAGGLVVNTGEVDGVVTLKENSLSVDVEGDKPYTCFGDCTITAWSSGNLACGGVNGQLIT